MAGTGDDHGLLDIAFLVELPDAFCGLISVQNGHVAVHEDQAIGITVAASIFHKIKSVLAV